MVNQWKNRGPMHIPSPGMKMGWKEKCMDSSSLATNETYQKFQRVEYMVWLAKVFGSMISFGSGQVANQRPSLSNRSLVQNECQGFLTWPDAVFACGLGLSPGAPLPTSAGLGFIDRRPTKNFRTEGVVCSKSAEKYILMEISAILLAVGRFGVKEEFFGIEPPMEGSRPLF